MPLFILGRLLSVLPVLFGVSVFVFLLVHLAPGDVTSTLTGPMATPDARDAIRVKLGLDRPLPVQYAIWFGNLLEGDFGTSWVHRRAVMEMVLPKFFNTAILALAAALLAYIIGFLAGVFAAGRRHGLADRIVMGCTLIAGSTPLYWLGLVLVFLFALKWRLLPATGMVNVVDGGGIVDVARHLVLPAVTASLPSGAIIARTTRATMLEVLGQNYIRVARAKGVPMRAILRKHALRNALPPIVTVAGMELGYLLGGVVFVEVVFAWPGIGNQLYASIIGRDIPTVQGAVLLIALAFVLINLVADVLNVYIEPRTRAAVTGGRRP